MGCWLGEEAEPGALSNRGVPRKTPPYTPLGSPKPPTGHKPRRKGRDSKTSGESPLKLLQCMGLWVWGERLMMAMDKPRFPPRSQSLSNYPQIKVSFPLAQSESPSPLQLQRSEKAILPLPEDCPLGGRWAQLRQLLCTQERPPRALCSPRLPPSEKCCRRPSFNSPS